MSTPSDPSGQTPSRKQAKSEARAEALARLKAEEKAKRRRRTLLQSLAAAVVVVLVVGGVVLLLNNQDDGGGGGSDEPLAVDGPVPAATTNDGGFTVGDPDAPVTVEVVEDFQCPVCQQFEAAAGDQLDDYAAGSDVKVVYRGIAFLDRASSTRYSSRALNASACVMDSGADVWKEFHKQLYLQQPPEGGEGLPDDQLASIAVAAGADEAAVSSCITDETYASWVEATTDRAGDDGVSGTPTLFVNGEKLSGFDPATLQSAVEEALAS